jgi:hypothetical protein
MTKRAATILALLYFLPVSISITRAGVTDSIPKSKKNSKFALTNLFNTGSMYYFTGVVSNNKPSFDTRLVYDNTRGNWGALLFKSFDLVDRNPAINYALVVLNKRYFVGPKLMISPQVGAQLNQIGTIAGPGTDFLTNLTIAYKFAKNLSISNDAVMQNLILTNRANWTNRIKLQYQKASFTASANIWDRNRIFDNPGYLAGGVYVAYSGIKLASNMNLVMTFSQIKVFDADTPRKSGMMLSAGVAF